MSASHSELPWVFALSRSGRSIHITTIDGTFIGEIYEKTWLFPQSVGERQHADARLMSACLSEHAASASFPELFRRAEGERLKDLDRLLRALGGDGLSADDSPEIYFERALLFIAELRSALGFYAKSENHLPGTAGDGEIDSLVEADAGRLASTTLASQP